MCTSCVPKRRIHTAIVNVVSVTFNLMVDDDNKLKLKHHSFAPYFRFETVIFFIKTHVQETSVLCAQIGDRVLLHLLLF